MVNICNEELKSPKDGERMRCKRKVKKGLRCWQHGGELKPSRHSNYIKKSRTKTLNVLHEYQNKQ